MKQPSTIRAYLLHLSYNMFCDRVAADHKKAYPGGGHLGARPYLRCDSKVWNELLQQLVRSGMNMVLIDLGDGVEYRSHPEIAVRGAWSRHRFKEELKRMRAMGLEPIPKLNFSACHDTWLGPYARCVSTETYYRVCKDLISEAIELFDKPRFFHLGMDEETARHQANHRYVVIRQYDLWWHDLFFYLNEVKQAGVRPWVWSDYVWHHGEEFFKRMPRYVLQSNWYYDGAFNTRVPYVKAFHDLEAHGYDQVPTGSNYYVRDNFPRLVRYCRKNLSQRHLLGFLQTVWKPTLKRYLSDHGQAIQLASTVLSND